MGTLQDISAEMQHIAEVALWEHTINIAQVVNMYGSDRPPANHRRMSFVWSKPYCIVKKNIIKIVYTR